MQGHPLADLNERSREIFRRIVEDYLETGEAIGSRTLSHRLPLGLSAASIRNTMQDLERAGLISAPHTSAGRLPTERGLRLFVDALLEVGSLTAEERAAIDERLAGSSRKPEDVLAEASALLSGLSKGAGLVTAPTANRPLRQVQFVQISQIEILAITVAEDGSVENRLLKAPEGLPVSALTEATNYLNARLAGRTLDEARASILDEIANARAELDAITARLVAAGLAEWSAGEARDAADKTLIVRGASKLLEDVTAAQDLDRIRQLFDDLEQRSDVVRLLEAAKDARGVKIFIGSENRLFSLQGSSVIAAPYADRNQRIVGALGVIGPTRLNYARVIPMVDYTAKVVSRLIG